MALGVAYGWVLGNPGASAMSSITLGRTHMTVKVRDDKVLYKPKESRTEVEMTGEDSVKICHNAKKLVFLHVFSKKD